MRKAIVHGCAAALALGVAGGAMAPAAAIAQARSQVTFAQFREAVRDGNAGRVRRLIREGADVNMVENGNTVLHEYRRTYFPTGAQYRTLAEKHYKMVARLKDNGFDFGVQGLIAANLSGSWKEDMRWLETLHAAGAPATGLSQAAFWEKADLMRWLVGKGADPNDGLREAARHAGSRPDLIAILLDAGATGPADADELQAIRRELAEGGAAGALGRMLQGKPPPRTCPAEGTSEDHDCRDAFDLLREGVKGGRPKVIEALAANGVSTASVDGWRSTVLHDYLADDAEERKRAERNGWRPPSFPSDAVQAGLASVIRHSPGMVNQPTRLGSTPAQIAARHGATKAVYDRVLLLVKHPAP